MADCNESRVAAVTGFWTRHAVTLERGAALPGSQQLPSHNRSSKWFRTVQNFSPPEALEPLTAVAAVLAICFGAPFRATRDRACDSTVSSRGRPRRFMASHWHSWLAAYRDTRGSGRAKISLPPWDIVDQRRSWGVVVAVAAARSRIVRQFLTLLAPAALVVPILFLLDPSVKQIFLASESPAAVQTIERTPPIVFVVFDEFPLNSLVYG